MGLFSDFSGILRAFVVDRPLRAKQSFYRTALAFSCLYNFMSLSDNPNQVEESHYEG